MWSDSIELFQLQDISEDVKEAEGLKVERTEQAQNLRTEDNGEETEQ